MSEMYDPEKVQKPNVCPVVGKQKVTVCLPVAVNPYAKTGPAKIHCCGDHEIRYGCKFCKGKPNAACEFTISQKLNVELPVEFGATVNVGDTFVDCDCPKEEDRDVCECKEEE